VKIYRFRHEDRPALGVLREDNLFLVKGSIFGDFEVGPRSVPIGDVTLLAPAEPSKIVAVGVNYREHALERGRGLPEEPLLFLKPPSAVVGPQETILYPRMSKRVDYEGELALVIKKQCRQLRDEEPVEDYILGYTCFNDVTARDIQPREGQFTRSKGFDTFAPMGPFIETDLDPGNAWIETYLNGQLRQSSSTVDLIFPVPRLIEYISEVMTLLPGDVIATGTPSGIGPMQAGDVVEVRIRGVGSLRNRVVAG